MTSRVRRAFITGCVLSFLGLHSFRSYGRPGAVDLLAEPAAWRVVSVDAFVHGGAISIREGLLRIGAGQPGTGARRVDAAKFPRENYEVRFEARRVEGFDFFCGLTFPVGAQHLTLILGGWDGEIGGLSNIDGATASENATRFRVDIEQDRWVSVVLRVNETRIFAEVDGKPVVDLARAGHVFSLHEAMVPMQPFGLATWRTGAEFRKMTLRAIPKDEELAPQGRQDGASASSDGERGQP